LFKFGIAQKLKKRIAAALASTSGAAALDNSRMGAYAALGAIALGGAMLWANIAREHSNIPVAATPISAAATSAVAAKRAPAPQSEPTPVAVAPPAPPAAPPEKSAPAVDMSTTGAIAPDPPVKHKHRTHPKKTKALDSAQ
jgi:outer membrane biosynthesis protein TonB